jgi:hypothetical protein
MQSNNNKSLENKSIKSKDSIDEILLNNKEIFNSLIIENMNRREKSFITVKEIDLIKQFENNLIKLVNMCPPKKAEKILNEISNLSNDK